MVGIVAEEGAMSTAAHIRWYVIENHIAPARAASDVEVRIRLGDIRQGMRLKNPLQSVRSALSTKVFQKEAGVELLTRIGPRDGADTLWHYRILPTGAVGRQQRAKDASGDGDASRGC